MAFHDTHSVAPRDILHNSLAGLRSFFGSLAHSVALSSEANRRLQTVEKLQALSDEELKALRIKRDDIIRHVFGDLYYS
ncbi:DUF1127 domain-containing protein [uncultured Roseobacter sp.]|uniref:DUF1127 domain-containing protein n=1 Tax=uncultured Roseobacter sp. TaxID=114847 RepID=UPI002602607D|nr:DUF1127 domain-containing protein [uncultured Roseobacter sp.]